jgi:hypothetical protein
MPMAISIKPTTNHVRQSWCSFFPLGFSLCMIVVFPQSECVLGYAASAAEARRQPSACFKIRWDPLDVRHVADFPSYHLSHARREFFVLCGVRGGIKTKMGPQFPPSGKVCIAGV